MTTIPANIPPAPPDTKLFSELVPEEFRDRPYLKEIMAMPQGDDATNALYKKLDGAQKLIGKKTGIPEAGAPQEEWDGLYAKLRLEKAEDYEIVAKDPSKIDPNVSTALKQAFHKAGITNGQGKVVQQVLIDAMSTQGKEFEASEAKINEEFARLTKETFAADNDEALKRTKELIRDNTPDNLKVHTQRLPNELLVVMMGVLNNIHAKYIAEDAPRDNKPGGGSGGDGDMVSIRNEMHKIQGSKEYQDAWHPQNKELRAKVAELAAELAKQKDAVEKK